MGIHDIVDGTLIEKNAEIAKLKEALYALGITDGEVNGAERWWWIDRDGNEPICDSLLEAATAMYDEYQLLARLVSDLGRA